MYVYVCMCVCVCVCADCSVLFDAVAPPLQQKGWLDVALAAEFKRASPSKGDIATELDLCGTWGGLALAIHFHWCISNRTMTLGVRVLCVEQVNAYADAGASMVSMLTEPKWFKGSLEDMLAARKVVEGMEQRPAILRKDFIIDVYQLLEARAYGADCVLLIVALLTQEQLDELVDVRA